MFWEGGVITPPGDFYYCVNISVEIEEESKLSEVQQKEHEELNDISMEVMGDSSNMIVEGRRLVSKFGKVYY